MRKTAKIIKITCKIYNLWKTGCLLADLPLLLLIHRWNPLSSMYTFSVSAFLSNQVPIFFRAFFVSGEFLCAGESRICFSVMRRPSSAFAIVLSHMPGFCGRRRRSSALIWDKVYSGCSSVMATISSIMSSSKRLLCGPPRGRAATPNR